MMDAEIYEQWYATPQGRWIGQREIALLLDVMREDVKRET